MTFRKFLWQLVVQFFNVMKAARITEIPIRQNYKLGHILYFLTSRLFFKHRSQDPVPIGEHMMYLTPDRIVFPGMYLGNQGQDGITRLMNNVLVDGMVIADVGAQIGFYTLTAAKRVGATGKVFAIEPEPGNYDTLVRSVVLNGYTNVVTLQTAVADRIGTVELFLSPDGGQHSIYRTFQWEKIIVPVTTLDDLSKNYGWPRVDMIIMDIEGGEPRALDGAIRLLQNGSPLMMILEFYPRLLGAADRDPKQFLRKLRLFGLVSLVRDDGRLESFDDDALLLRLKDRDAVNLFCDRRV